MAISIPPTRVVAAILAAAAIAVPFVAENEGRPANTYIDSGGVLTGGFGHTGPEVPKAGTPVPEHQALSWLASDLVDHGVGLARPGCMSHQMIVTMPAGTLAVFQDWALNVGVNAACKKPSTLVKLVNAGDLKGACYQLLEWKYDNGKVIRGLVLRRERELKKCLEALK